MVREYVEVDEKFGRHKGISREFRCAVKKRLDPSELSGPDVVQCVDAVRRHQWCVNRYEDLHRSTGIYAFSWTACRDHRDRCRREKVDGHATGAMKGSKKSSDGSLARQNLFVRCSYEHGREHDGKSDAIQEPERVAVDSFVPREGLNGCKGLSEACESQGPDCGSDDVCGDHRAKCSTIDFIDEVGECVRRLCARSMCAYRHDVVGLLKVSKLDDGDEGLFDNHNIFEDAGRPFFKDLEKGVARNVFGQKDGDIDVALFLCPRVAVSKPVTTKCRDVTAYSLFNPLKNDRMDRHATESLFFINLLRSYRTFKSVIFELSKRRVSSPLS